MPRLPWIALGALWTGLAVALGAYGTHGLREALEESGGLATWETAVRYQAWHGLGLVLFGLWRVQVPGSGTAGALLFLGSLLFSGSLYGLSLDGPGLLGPVTPLGGALLLAGWGLFAWSARVRGGGAADGYERGVNTLARSERVDSHSAGSAS